MPFNHPVKELLSLPIMPIRLTGHLAGEFIKCRQKNFIIFLVFLTGLIIIANIKDKNKEIWSDKIIDGNYTIAKGQTVTIKNKAKLTVNGDLQIKGTLTCEEGPLDVKVKGSLFVDGQIKCQRRNPVDRDPGVAILLTAPGSVEFTRNSAIIANGHIEVTDKAENLLLTQQSTNRNFDDIVNQSHEKITLGPLWGEDVAQDPNTPAEDTPDKTSQNSNLQKEQTKHRVKINGTWILGDPKETITRELRLLKIPPSMEKIIFYISFPSADLEFNNARIYLQDGQKGNNINVGCQTTAAKEPKTDAPRMFIQAENILINNFMVRLGDGGPGGNIETPKDCPDIRVIGSEGGLPGDFKIIAENNLNIIGRFNIFPGSTGSGGSATANSLAKCDETRKRVTYAEGGKGLNNYQTLRFSPSVSGVENIFMGNLLAGHGGNAYINQNTPETGQAVGGPGGIALIKLPEFTFRTDNFDGDQNGSDGRGEIKDLPCN